MGAEQAWHPAEHAPKPIAHDWTCGLVLWARAALGILFSRPDTFSTDDFCIGLTPLQFPLADFPWFWHLWTFLDSPLWLKFHLLNFMQWPWRALLQGVNPSIHCLHLAVFWIFGAPLVFPSFMPTKAVLCAWCSSSAGSRYSLSLLEPTCSGLCAFGETHPLAAILQQGTRVVALSV